MTSNAFDVFILPMVVWLGEMFIAVAAVKALAIGVDHLAGHGHGGRSHGGRGVAARRLWRHRPI
ncbi:MAG TPA: hypothetical protein VG406_23730 [Isosphaeraceae bacterium]|jgi:hypothetical protein|nr:hypothetical protein [Isosphaeraceae bacterium]